MNDLDVYERQNFGNQSGFGDRPALLIVDFVNGFADPDAFGGGNIGEAIANTKRLLADCRAKGVPIAYTRVVYADDGSDAGVFCLKAPGLVVLTEDAAASQVVDELAPIDGEYIVRKTQPSAFFGTSACSCSSAGVISVPASNLPSSKPTFTPCTSTRWMFTKPRLGTRRAIGNCPPSN